ncbi:LA_3781 family PerA/PerB upregulated protein [Leptospira yasudae]|uniref:Lipoprotein n=1 Tax=Leptospira yasudae TaxID=2202201 RepID=A0ABX9M7A9_9LEPT|nr:hypothetical protein [Leptospira yasudae]MBW0432620.1 hypothetical protein [Leptospira yasudae]RHX81516.1 hypothetical protein DLM77_05355 [Leptospira yasudae]TGK29759.1 hypothetical protein EHQ05_01985 [Leptospira yasudae]TGM07616.1 hypothetical protein EHQ86_06030 [Leptospira yasudae]TGN01389.1 hypothetical protein EHR10_07090 [Leptospira yasudae]
MRFLKTILLAISIGAAAGCHNTTLQIYNTSEAVAFPVETKADQTYKQGGYAVGLIESFDTPEVKCQEGKPQILIQRNFWDNVIHWTIGGIYTRRTVQVFCKR